MQLQATHFGFQMLLLKKALYLMNTDNSWHLLVAGGEAPESMEKNT
jgi:hypothetical protein